MARNVAAPQALAGGDSMEVERRCWMCLETDKEDGGLAWVNPCLCGGTRKWVHESCVSLLIDEVTRTVDNDLQPVSCPICETEYNISYPNLGIFDRALKLTNGLILKHLYNCLAIVFKVAFAYLSATSFGAITYMQITGQEGGVHQIIQSGDLLLILIGFPLISVVLILGRMIPWEDALLRFIISLPRICLGPEYDQTEPYPPAPMNENSGSRVFCGAILLPTISMYVGRVLYSSVDDKLQQTLFGGLTFIAIKGILKMYLMHNQYILRMQRRVLDYTDENLVELDGH
ncbi:E3 ubiquitin-protein ligase MARCH5 [Drosophila mauritiana]|uniref:E3 ubiquitin-protein ligase MARCHF5 n=1 Tax=Drosophila mauritiana TaxID=7226 RepID=A0A6P8K316_DROMA|nr:E3 ubiquitin-protein ligase MARCH5 [Drosophila mauritiana]